MLNMKKNLLLLIIFLMLGSVCHALEPIPVQLGAIENSLWGFEYKKENEQIRLKRIEDTVFGVVDSKTSVQERINKINQTLGLDNGQVAESTLKELEEIEGKNVAYPIIDKLELEFLKKNYQTDGIYPRLERLEKSVFGAKQGGELNERVDRLVGSSTINSPKYAQFPRKDAQGANNFGSGEQQPYDPYNADAFLLLAGLENSIFGQTYGQDPVGLRLNRLERKVFQRDFSNDDEFTRMQRLQAASTAKNTAKYYDGNKIQKYTSTGIQIGTILLMILAFIL